MALFRTHTRLLLFLCAASVLGACGTKPSDDEQPMPMSWQVRLYPPWLQAIVSRLTGQKQTDAHNGRGEFGDDPAANGGELPPSTLPPEPELGGTDEELAQNGNNPAVDYSLSAAEEAARQKWIRTIGEPRPNETFGEFVARVASIQIGQPYGNPPSLHQAEQLRLSFRAFQCVSFVESSLAMARCLWAHKPDLGCFAQELISLRYRGGHVDGYISRLHYYSEWMTDNATRGRLALLTPKLGGTPVARTEKYMTNHPKLYGPLVDPNIFAQVAQMEAQVSMLHPCVIGRNQIQAVSPWLQSGDVVAITSFRRDILVTHTGFVKRDADGALHLLHASSAKRHVALSRETLSEYILGRSGRAGMMVARPLPPMVPESSMHNGLQQP